MPASCPTKTLRLMPGAVYRGMQNTGIALNGTASVSIEGPATPAPLRVGPGGAAEPVAGAGVPAASAVATIDGEGAQWLFAVRGNASLTLRDVALVRGRGGQFDRGDGTHFYGGGAVLLLAAARLSASGVLFESNTAAVQAGSMFAASGAAIFTASLGTAALRGCTFRNNSASHSGGAALVWGASPAVAALVAPTFEQCVFQNNAAWHSGGATYVHNASPRFTGCTWTGNRIGSDGGGSGGGVEVYGGSGAAAAQVAPAFDQCAFQDNTAGHRAGGARVHNASPRFTGCTWTGNRAGSGSKGYGGGVEVHGSSATAAAQVAPTFDQCAFQDNTAGQSGGGTRVQDASPRFTGCAWTGNSVNSVGNSEGGGVYVLGRTAASAALMAIAFEQCTFQDNAAGERGGGTSVYDASPRFTGCTWTGNRVGSGSKGYGGGVEVHGSSATAAAQVVPAFDQCAFQDNTAGQSGGGTFVTDVSPRFTGCTWTGNRAGRGGALNAEWTSRPSPPATLSLAACRFLDNTATGPDGGGAIAIERAVADAPANLAFLPGACHATPRGNASGPSSCVKELGAGWCCQQPADAATPPAHVNGTYRRYDHSTRMLFENGATFDSNSATNPTALGGALYVAAGGDVSFGGDNVTFCHNRVGFAGGAVALSSGTASLRLLGASSWSNNTAGGARGDHLYSASAGAMALGNATLRLSVDPTRVREGVVIGPAAGEVTWGSAGGMACEAGYTLAATTQVSSATSLDWTLGPSYNGAAGDLIGSNCPEYFNTCVGGRSTVPGWGRYNDPKATAVFPVMRATRVSVGCAACGATQWSTAAAQQPTPGHRIAAASAAQPLPRTCAPCDATGSAAMSPGLVCEAGVLQQKPGWWRPSGTAEVGFGTELYECFSDACIGSGQDEDEDSDEGESGADDASLEARGELRSYPAFDSQCEEGYTGPVCALCTANYSKHGNECVACPPLNASNVAGTIALVFAVLALLLLLYRKRHDARWQRPVVLKITLTFLEMISLMNETFSTRWPDEFRSLASTLRGAFASVEHLSAQACASHMHRFAALAVWTMGVLAVLAAIYGRHRWRAAQSGGDAAARSASWKSCIYRIFWVLFFAYPLLSPIVISIFICRTIAGTPYLVADYTVTCDTSTWTLAALWAGLWTVFFVVGFPLALLVALRRRDGRVPDFVSAVYRDEGIARYWEVVDFGKKLFLSTVLLAVPEGTATRLSLAVLASGILLVATVWHKPYHEHAHNRLELAAMSALSLAYFIGLMIKVHPGQSQRRAFGVILVLLVVGVAFAAVAAAIGTRRIRRHAFRKRSAPEPFAALGDIELQTDVEENPAYAGADGESGGDEASCDSSESRAAAGVVLVAELERVKKSRGEYAAARVAAAQAELEERHAAELEESRQAQAEQEQKHAAELEVSRTEAAQQREEAAQLRAELAQLKEKSA
eukprot:g4612.t1